MGIDGLGPIFSGTLGGLIAVLICYAWSKWVPRTYGGKSSETLVFQFRWAIRFANLLSLVGVLVGIALYPLGGYDKGDWRPIGIGFGFALASPLFVLPVVAMLGGCKPSEAYIAYSISQKVPPIILFTLLAAGIPLLAVSAAKLFW